ncbi:Replicative DNA helicase [Bibersteinia trehalosi USDA-ARS-USMARC-189]|nr:Replicative DNA helicase [Bibersteinia trehalosi USDA-ARS-USMARC-189]
METLSRIEMLSNSKNNGGVTGVSTGFIDLDKRTAGLQPSDLIIVAARPSMGKTTFAMNLCENASMLDIEVTDENGNVKKVPNKPVLIFSLEMPAEQIMMRMFASLSRVNQTKIRTGQLEDEEDMARIASTVAMLQERANIYIDDSSGLTPTELRSRARRVYKDNGGLSLIMVDYLQLMRAPGFADNRTLEIAEISRSLKALAKELEVPVVALSQLNRSLEQRADKRPVNSDLRESGSIEQDADLIMFIYRDEVYHENSEKKGIAEIIIGKQRNGPIGRVPLTFNGQWSRFDNYTGNAYNEED